MLICVAANPLHNYWVSGYGKKNRICFVKFFSSSISDDTINIICGWKYYE